MSKVIKFVFASDTHGDLACDEALTALYEYCSDFKPDIRIAGGDHYDLRSIRKGASGDREACESMLADIDAGKQFFAKFRPTHYQKGNHEHRLAMHARSHTSGLVRDYCADKDDEISRHARKCGAKVVLPYHHKLGVLRIGPLTTHHGIGTNLQRMGMHYATDGGIFICGHGHTGHQVNLPKHNGGAAYMAPCLCRIDEMDYASGYLNTARWNNGFVAGWISGNDCKAWIVHKVGGRWIWQTDLKVWTPKP